MDMSFTRQLALDHLKRTGILIRVAGRAMKRRSAHPSRIRRRSTALSDCLHGWPVRPELTHNWLISSKIQVCQAHLARWHGRRAAPA